MPFSSQIIFKIFYYVFFFGSPRKFDERMLDDQDDTHSTHSIGIVENPLYAEQEEYNSPSYASLKKKEADVSQNTLRQWFM